MVESILKKILLHTFSIASVTWVFFQLTFWLILLIPVSLGKLLFRSANKFWSRVVSFIYHGAVFCNTIWMKHVIGVKINIEGKFKNHPSPIVISNHQSWVDIPIIHHAITDRGPIIKFLVKRQLVWVPIIGWLCLILGFPRLHRGKGHGAREKDYATIRKFSEKSNKESGAILIFPEGTRFSEAKRKAQSSPYRHLLNPRIGGLRILKEAGDPDTPIIDLTLIYLGGNSNFWECLHGATSVIEVKISVYRLGDIEDLSEWLSERWKEKESLISLRQQRVISSKER